MESSGNAHVDSALRELGNVLSAGRKPYAHLLGDYLHTLLRVAASDRRVSGAEREACLRAGAAAAEEGVALPGVVDLYLSASRRLWPQLPDLVAALRGRAVRPTEIMRLGESVWQAADDAVSALAAGYVDAQLALVRSAEASRQQLVDDLLTGSGGLASLVERAEPFGLSLAAAHLVAAVQLPQPVEVSSRATDLVQHAARGRFGAGRSLLVTAKDGLLVCALSAGPDQRAAAADSQLADLVSATAEQLAEGGRWRVAIGRAYAGPLGISRSWSEALDALQVADRLDLPDPVVHFKQLLVYRVLQRDEAALADLVEDVLGPLAAARDGRERLLPTLDAYIASGANTAAAARALHLSVRAMNYRLQRISRLTGHSTTAPEDRLALSVAVVGARLLDWPRSPLPSQRR